MLFEEKITPFEDTITGDSTIPLHPKNFPPVSISKVVSTCLCLESSLAFSTIQPLSKEQEKFFETVDKLVYFLNKVDNNVVRFEHCENDFVRVIFYKKTILEKCLCVWASIWSARHSFVTKTRRVCVGRKKLVRKV